MNAPDVIVFGGNWLPGNEDRSGACIVSTNVSWSDEGNWKRTRDSNSKSADGR